jgi:ubiquinone/menaquinone biosynthesis C-methylase UbiE
MDTYKPAMSFGDDAVENYDELSRRGDEVATVAFLEQLARGGPALELAIGTGRIALPLAAQGVQVDGIDFSPSMIAKLRAKPGGTQIAVTLGNFADVAVPDTYRLIYVVFASRTSQRISLKTAFSSLREVCRPNSAAYATINTLTWKRLQSTMCVSTWLDTIPSRNCSKRPM